MALTLFTYTGCLFTILGCWSYQCKVHIWDLLTYSRFSLYPRVLLRCVQILSCPFITFLVKLLTWHLYRYETVIIQVRGFLVQFTPLVIWESISEIGIATGISLTKSILNLIRNWIASQPWDAIWIKCFGKSVAIPSPIYWYFILLIFYNLWHSTLFLCFTEVQHEQLWSFTLLSSPILSVCSWAVHGRRVCQPVAACPPPCSGSVTRWDTASLWTGTGPCAAPPRRASTARLATPVSGHGKGTRTFTCTCTYTQTQTERYTLGINLAG